MPTNPIRPALFKFLRDLSKNNSRPWFQDNKARYESDVKEPLLAFIDQVGVGLRKVSPQVDASPRALFRIYRDTRFSKDKTPYKTNAGVHFRHVEGRSAHAPGLYLHLEPGKAFIGTGIWHPEPKALGAIRQHIVDNAAQWKKITSSRTFKSRFRLEGDSLKRPPRGFDAEHPLIDDLKRKDFITISALTQADACDAQFPRKFVETCKAASPFVGFVCDALDLE